MIDVEKRNSKKFYKTYKISKKGGLIKDIEQCRDNDEIYEQRSGFYRRANVSGFNESIRPKEDELFVDPDYSINFSQVQDMDGHDYKPRRLYDVYENENNIFEGFDENSESFIDYRKNYCSFATEFGLIDKIYLQSIFITRNINKEGYYEYFVRRNGEFHVEYMDDIIPVEGLKKLPIWGLSYACPWELLLMKAWLKEKKGIKGVIEAEPFEFLYAFGLPGYSAKNIKRELDFLRRENSDMELKRRKEEKLPLNKPEFNILAKTRNDEKVEQLGLIKNCLGYKIMPIKPAKSMVSRKSDEKPIYKVHSTVPSKWIGSLSVVNTRDRSDFDFKKYSVNLEKEFLATEEEILAIFSKYYIARDYFVEYDRQDIYQDSYIVDNAEENEPTVFELQVHENGIMNINIEFMERDFRKEYVKGVDQVRWPYIKYFLSKENRTANSSQMEGRSERGIPGEFEPNLEKYEYYDIDFVKGYHRSSNRFLNIEKGTYMLYVKIQNLKKGSGTIDYSINISSSARFKQLELQNLNPYQRRELVDSTIFQYGKIHGQKFIKDNSGHFYIGNCFREVGFGFLACEVREKSRGKSIERGAKSKLALGEMADLGIRVLPENLRKLKLAAYYYQEKDGIRSRIETSQQPISMIARLGYPKIIVLENPKYDFELREEFPEPGSIEVFNMKRRRS